MHAPAPDTTKNFLTFFEILFTISSFLRTLIANPIIILLPSFEESNVENGRIIIDKLENKNFKSQCIFIVRLGPMHF